MTSDLDKDPAWLKRFREVVAQLGGVRSTGRHFGLSHSSTSRIARGLPLDMTNARIVGPRIGICPCCNQTWKEPKEVIMPGRLTREARR